MKKHDSINRLKLAYLLISGCLSVNSLVAQQNSFPDCSIHVVNPDTIQKDESVIGLFNYNRVVPVDFFTQTNSFYDNEKSGQTSLFMAFASKPISDDNILSMSCGKRKIEITNQKINFGATDSTKISDATNGLILNFQYNFDPPKKIILKFNQEFSDTIDNKLLEVLFFPKTLSSNERYSIETYLSIKYGISLDNHRYINSLGEIIWDTNLNVGYQQRITGIGRDDSLRLFQKQSNNSQSEGLTVGLSSIKNTNRENLGMMNNLSFLLWGDNGGSTQLMLDSLKGYSTLERMWKFQFSSLTDQMLGVQFSLSPERFLYQYDTSKNNPLWLVRYDSTSNPIEFFRQDTSSVKGMISFSSIKMDTADTFPNYFSFIQAPEMFAITSVDESPYLCQNLGNLGIRIIGGTSSFSAILSSNKFNKIITTSEPMLIIDSVPSGKYSLLISDSFGHIFKKTVIIPEKDIKLPMLVPSLVQLEDDNTAEITPLSLQDPDSLRYCWNFHNVQLSDKITILVHDTGTYWFTVTNENGCAEQFPVSVVSGSLQNDQISIFPNPVHSMEKFTVKAQLHAVSDITISLYNGEGKCVSVWNSPEILSSIYENKLYVPGIYLVIINTIMGSHHYKLVVIP